MQTLPKRLSLARLPTPTTELTRFTRARAPKRRIFVKRDDETGSVLTGNKIRKLQFVAQEALDEGADTLVTRGGVQSNHCRATAVLARSLGLDVALLLRGSAGEKPQGNLLLDRVLGARLRFVDADTYSTRGPELLEAFAAELRAEGRRPYVIDEGCSIPLGNFGYIEACREIAESQSDLGLEFDALVCAAGSGGTSAGLELGRRIYGLSAPVYSINVCDDADYFRAKIAGLCRATAKRWPQLLAGKAPPTVGEICVLDGHTGPGYGIATPEQYAVLRELAETEGIVLDPVYTAKAFLGMCKELGAGGALSHCRAPLFVHTGGCFGLEAHADELLADL